MKFLLALLLAGKQGLTRRPKGQAYCGGRSHT